MSIYVIHMKSYLIAGESVIQPTKSQSMLQMSSYFTVLSLALLYNGVIHCRSVSQWISYTGSLCLMLTFLSHTETCRHVCLCVFSCNWCYFWCVTDAVLLAIAESTTRLR